ncbi:hypothetical protein Tco_0375786 [Tanacetum coccineum]
MNKQAEQTEMPATASKGRKQATDGNLGYLPEDKLWEICEKHYNQICPSWQRRFKKKSSKGPKARHATNMQTKGEVRARAVNDREKSKENGTQLIARTADNQLELKKLVSQKTSMTKDDIGSPYQRNKGQLIRKIYPNHGYAKKPILLQHGFVISREGNSTEAFMDQFKVESMHVNGVPECMRISGFMQDITNPDLIKRLNDNIPKSVEELMSATTAFLWGEVVVANQSRKKAPPAYKHHEASHKPNFDKRLDFKNRHKPNRRQDRFTPLIKTPKEILPMETVKFKAPPPMFGPVESQNKNKFCEFHKDKGHSTDKCIHLQKQIEEAFKSGQLSHLIKELKHGGNKGEHAKTAKKGDTSNKEKATTILMAQPWQ